MAEYEDGEEEGEEEGEEDPYTDISTPSDRGSTTFDPVSVHVSPLSDWYCRAMYTITAMTTTRTRITIRMMNPYWERNELVAVAAREAEKDEYDDGE